MKHLQARSDIGQYGIFIGKNKPPCDKPLAVLTLIIALFGTLMVFSAGSAYSAFRYGDPYFFVKRQTVWLIIGIATMVLASNIRPAVYRFITPYLYGITLFLLVLVLAVGLVGNGAQRWISIGPITIQPSEIAKMTMVMMLAYYFSAKGESALDHTKRKNALIYGTLIPCIIMAIPIILVMLQKHLSCIIILGVIGLLVIIASGIDTRYISLLSAVGAAGVAFIAFFTDYTKDRITVWRDPESYKLTGGWQTLQGLMAIGSGGAFGLGYGKSVLKHCYVSEPANDMIFAILCEELGFVGAMLALALFSALVIRGYRIALHAEGSFERIVTFGIFTKIAVQTLLNVAVVTNTIPNTGISLPFFSYGGSSLIMLFFEIGMVLSFSRYSAITK
ncbi:MAG: cell division protein FtsW [Ruminococcaceae bacterium]|nr:cell division protein FtsW [Oscillospiraceae bacterium]